jgi:hypothetical protein
VDITRAAMEHARLVIAQVNPAMPRTWGDSFVHIDEIDHFVLAEEPLVEMEMAGQDNEVAQRIGHFVSQLVEDGATLQIGFGYLPNTILKYLDGKTDLGVHTQLVTDGLLPLFEKGVITNRKKSLLPGRVVASLCMGTRKLYRFVDNNPAFYFRSSEFVNDPTQIARNDHLISISSALEVDLTGQVCSDSMGHLFYSGIGDQVDFLRGSAMSIDGAKRHGFPDRTPSLGGCGRCNDPGRRQFRGHGIRYRGAPGKGHLPAGDGAGPDRPSEFPGPAHRVGQAAAVHFPRSVAAVPGGPPLSGELQEQPDPPQRANRPLPAPASIG